MLNDEQDNYQLPAKLDETEMARAGENLLKDCARAPFLKFDKNKYYIGEEEIPAGIESMVRRAIRAIVRHDIAQFTSRFNATVRDVSLRITFPALALSPSPRR